jgi:hypothetical protein
MGICCCCLRKIFLIMGFLFWLNIARLDVYIYILLLDEEKIA